MKRQSGMEKKKRNNSGFSLLEVLVAVVILGIVSIPLIRSFGTAAVTNYKANVLMLSTECAENMMETVEFLNVDELVAQFTATGNTITEDANGVYNFTIKADVSLPDNLPDGYYVEMKLDPSKFPNNNAVNVADVKSMSIQNSAVYEMSNLYDANIYSVFHNRNEEASDTSSRYIPAPTDYFKKNLTRYIDVTIRKQGTGQNDKGETVDLIIVDLDIRYGFQSATQYWRYLPTDQSEYVEETQELFNNLTTKEELTGIYVFYQPRFMATSQGNADVINIYNPDNIETDVFIAAQSSGADQYSLDMYYNMTTGPLVTIEETWTETNPTDAAVTLYTNLSEGAPYSELSGTDGEILCRLTYQDSGLLGTSITGNDALKILDGRDLDGKVLIGSNTKDRIYKVTATVKDPSGNKIVELDGTKLE